MTSRNFLNWQMIFELDAGGGPVTIDARPEELAVLVPAMFPQYVKTAAGDTVPVSPAVVVNTESPGFTITRQNRRPKRATTLADAVDELEYAITEALLATVARMPHLHASGVTGNGALLALGESGAGKSSLALAWSRMGLSVLGDDVVLLGRKATAYPFKRLFKVSADALDAHGLDPGATPLWLGENSELWFDPAAAGGWSEPARVAQVALIERRGGSGLEIEPVERSEGLAALVHGLLETGAGQPAAFDPLFELAAHARFQRVRYGSSIDAAEALADLVR